MDTPPAGAPVETIGDRIKAILARLGITASELSRRAGLTRVHVGKIITRSKNPDATFENDTMVAIAKAAGVDVGWLMTGKSEGGTPPPMQTAMRVELTERYAGRAEAAKRNARNSRPTGLSVLSAMRSRPAS